MSDRDVNDPGYWDNAAANYEAVAHPFTAHFAEAAVARLNIGSPTRVLDVATGTGAAALAAVRAGADVLAIDFSAEMVRRVLGHGLSKLDARQMDGQALDLPDASFDVVLSIFGVMLFPDWRAGLLEMARVTRPGGSAAVAVWKDDQGSAVHLLLSQVYKALYPERALPAPFEGMAELSNSHRLSMAMLRAGFRDPSVEEVTHDFQLKVAALDDAHQLFGQLPLWKKLEPSECAAVLGEIQIRAERERVGDALPISSTALIATARRT